MECENSSLLIETIAISPSNLFFLIGYENGEVHIYSLMNEEYIAKNMKKMKPAPCECLAEVEESLKEKPTSLSFFSKIVKIKDMIFDKPKKAPFSTLTFINNNKPYSSFFIKKNEVALVSDSKLEKYKFSSLEEGRAWCYKQIEYKNDISGLNYVDESSIDNTDNEIV